MMKIKLRYKMLFLNLIISLLYYFSGRIYFNVFYPNTHGVGAYFKVLFKILTFISYYNLINLLWISFIIYGKVKNNKEVYFTGFYSLILSVMIFISLILYSYN